ncbi:MAG: hypothetical protein IT436_08735 [Phycisphaerales bacterium]|nr:hypothetical protein [Phycisphaerales bacterium]
MAAIPPQPPSAPQVPHPSAAPISPAGPAVRRGVCHVLFAYDIGFSIDLERAQRLIAEGASREVLGRKRHAPAYFTFDPPPVRVSEPGPAVKIGGYETEPGVEFLLFDFGAVSVGYRIPVSGLLPGLLDLSLTLNEHHELLLDSRRRVDAMLEMVREAVARPGVTDFVEDYLVFELHDVEGDGAALVEGHRGLLAKILRGERREQSAQEVEDALACRVSYGADDLALVDWNAALVVDRDPEDVRTVLEFANVELLEMRHLDDRLDHAMDEAYEGLSRQSRWQMIFPGGGGGSLRRIAELQADGAQLFESVNNALKLIGDQYLARVYRVAAQRLHLPEWDASILRKIGILDSLYGKLADRRTNRRMETLEWIIIALIAFEIVLSLWRG